MLKLSTWFCPVNITYFRGICLVCSYRSFLYSVLMKMRPKFYFYLLALPDVIVHQFFLTLVMEVLKAIVFQPAFKFFMICSWKLTGQRADIFGAFIYRTTKVSPDLISFCYSKSLELNIWLNILSQHLLNSGLTSPYFLGPFISMPEQLLSDILFNNSLQSSFTIQKAKVKINKRNTSFIQCSIPPHY